MANKKVEYAFLHELGYHITGVGELDRRLGKGATKENCVNCELELISEAGSTFVQYHNPKAKVTVLIPITNFKFIQLAN